MLLAGIMTQAGFELSDSEWWHFTLPAARSYPVLQDDRIQRPVQEQKVATPDPQEG
jgi:D-alanyl-D-alanine dipeptidase